MRRRLVRIAVGIAVALALLVVLFVAYVNAVADDRLLFPDTPIPAIASSTDAAVIARGRSIVQGVGHCVACHGDYDVAHPEAMREDLALSGGYVMESPFGTFRAANLTPDRDTGLGAWSDGEIARLIRTGVARDGHLSVTMMAVIGDLGDDDLAAVISYLRSVAPVSRRVAPSEPSFLARAFVVLVGFSPSSGASIPDVPEGPEPSVARGRYLASVGMCRNCHSPADATDFLSPDPARLFAGGDPMPGHDPAHPELEYVAPNLTSDPETGTTGRMSEDQFIDRFRTIGRTGTGSPMPWEPFGRLSDGDLRSLYRYIRSEPPIRRDVGPHEREAGSFSPPP